MEKKVVLHQVKHSPSSIFTKQDVIDLITGIDENPIQVIVQEQEVPMVSLFEYLGHAAGAQLGTEVYIVANQTKQIVDTRAVETVKYKGKVMLYPKTFLKEYFESKRK